MFVDVLRQVTRCVTRKLSSFFLFVLQRGGLVRVQLAIAGNEGQTKNGRAWRRDRSRSPCS
jgi:hypothetical protein